MFVCPWRVSQISAFSDLHVSFIKRASHLHPSTSRINSSTRSVEFSDITCFCRTIKVASLSCPFSRFTSVLTFFRSTTDVTSFSLSFSRSASFFSLLLPHGFLPTLPASFSHFFLLLPIPFALLLLPLSFILGSASLASSLCFVCTVERLRRRVEMLVSLRLFLSPSFCFSFLFHTHLQPHAQWTVTVNMHESLSASASSLRSFVLLIFAHCLFFMTTQSHPFPLTLDPHNTTARSRCDEFFVNHVFANASSLPPCVGTCCT